MADLYTEENGSKRKYLVPLVILLLCAVSLTGAAYAYSSTMDVNNNPMTDDAALLTLSSDADGKTLLADGSVKMDLDWASVTATDTTDNNKVKTKWTVDTTNTSKDVTVYLNLTTNFTYSKDNAITVTLSTTATDKTVFNCIKVTSDDATVSTITDGKFTVTLKADVTKDAAAHVKLVFNFDTTALETAAASSAPVTWVHDCTFNMEAKIAYAHDETAA